MGTKYSFNARVEILDKNPIDSEGNDTAVVDKDVIFYNIEDDPDYAIYTHKNKTLNIGESLIINYPNIIKYVLIKSEKPVTLRLSYEGGGLAELTIEKFFNFFGEVTQVTIVGKEDNSYTRCMVLGKNI